MKYLRLFIIAFAVLSTLSLIGCRQVDSILGIKPGHASEAVHLPVRQGTATLYAPLFYDSSGDTIEFDVSISNYSYLSVSLIVYDTSRNVIQTLIDDQKESGNQTVLWQNPRKKKIYGVVLVSGQQSHEYWFYSTLGSVDSGGNGSFGNPMYLSVPTRGPVVIAAGTIPKVYSFSQPWFTDSTEDEVGFTYDLPKTSPVSLSIYDNNDNVVSKLIDSTQNAGEYYCFWPNPKSSQIYGAQLTAGPVSKTWWFYSK